MTVELVIPIGGFYEDQPDSGLHEPFDVEEELIVSDPIAAPSSGDLNGRPPGFPWGGHSNGVSQRP